MAVYRSKVVLHKGESMNSPNDNEKLTIDQFNVNKETRQTLKRMGFEEVAEVAEWLVGMQTGSRPIGLIRNIGERNMKDIIAQLRLLELWSFEN